MFNNDASAWHSRARVNSLVLYSIGHPCARSRQIEPLPRSRCRSLQLFHIGLARINDRPVGPSFRISVDVVPRVSHCRSTFTFLIVLVSPPFLHSLIILFVYLLLRSTFVLYYYVHIIYSSLVRHEISQSPTSWCQVTASFTYTNLSLCAHIPSSHF